MESIVVYCTSCGEANAEDAKFCYKCGKAMYVSELSIKNQLELMVLSSLNCGRKIDVTLDMDHFVCQFCGHEHIIRRNGNLISLLPVEKEGRHELSKFDQVINGSDLVTIDQNIQRLMDEITIFEKHVTEKTEQLKKVSKLSWKILWLLLLLPAVILVWGNLIRIINRWLNEWIPDSIIGSIYTFTMYIGIFATLIILLILIVKKIPSQKNKNRLRQVQTELTQAQIELQARKIQLDQLQKNTVER